MFVYIENKNQEPELQNSVKRPNFSLYFQSLGLQNI